MTFQHLTKPILKNGRCWVLGGLLFTVIGAQPAFSTPVTVSPPPAGLTEDSSLIAFPEHTLEGRLANGLHYLILPNATPANTVEMRLVMRLGAVQETEKQKGCAHFLEHMAFAGTKHYPKRSMIDYLESLGMKFGRDINAVTGYDRTIFMLTVPMKASDLGVLDSTLLVLKDWLTAVDFKADRVRQERGVILEELRTYRNDDVFYDLKIGQSRFKDRMPLGSADDIRKVERKDLIRFYQKWYTPQLASVVVVGNIQPAEVERRIQRLFADIPSKDVEDYQIYPLTYAEGTQLMEVQDSIKQKSVLELIIPHEGTIGSNRATTLQKEQERLAAYALDRRFSARHLACTVSDNWYLSDSHHFVFSFSGNDKEDLLKKVTRLASEVQQILTQGWNADELTQIKNDFASAITLNEDGRASATYCDDFVDYILQGDRYLHTQQEVEELQQGIRDTDAELLQNHLKGILKRMEKTLLLAYRNNSGPTDRLTQTEVAEAWEKGLHQEAPEFVYRHFEVTEKVVPTPACLTQMPEVSSSYLLQEKNLPDTHITEVRLQNGIRLLFRPTPEADETVLVNYFGKGGLAHLEPELYHQYESTAGFMEMGGIRKVPYDTLCDYMAQSGLLLNISIGAFWHDLLGTAPADQSLELFNLICEKLQRPELCRDDFEEVRADELKELGKETVLDQMMQRTPDRLLVNRMDSLVGNSPSTWFREKTAADVQQMNLDSMANYFTTLYTQLEGTTIVITGNYPLEKVKQQAIAVFGKLESARPHHAMTTSLPEFKFPQQKYVEGFENDNETQTVLEYVYPGHFSPSLKNGLVLKLMRDLLQDRMLRVLREQENVVYSPYASLYYYGAPQNSYYFNLSLSVDTENSKKTDRLVQGIIHDLQHDLVSQQELNKLKRAFLVNKQQVLTENAATDWRNILATMVKNGEEIEDFEHYQQQLDSITPETVREAFRQYLVPEKTVLLYLGKHQLYD